MALEFAASSLVDATATNEFARALGYFDIVVPMLEGQRNPPLPSKQRRQLIKKFIWAQSARILARTGR